MGHYLGELSALGGALSWAIATLIFNRFSHHLSALQMTLTKGVIAALLMMVTLWLWPEPLHALPIKPAAFLALSGLIGIAIGDSAYFAALRRIGPNRTLLLESLAPPLSGLLALVLLGSTLPLLSWLGVFVTTAGVTWVVMKPNPAGQLDWCGIGYGLLASVCQATGVVISHYALVDSGIPPLYGATLRLATGTLVIALWLGLRQPQALLELPAKLYQQSARLR